MAKFVFTVNLVGSRERKSMEVEVEDEEIAGKNYHEAKDWVEEVYGPDVLASLVELTIDWPDAPAGI